MTIKLLHNTPLWIASTAIRKCWQSEDKSDTDYIYVCPKCGSENIEEFNGCYAGKWICNSCKYEDFTDPIEVKQIGAKDRALIEKVGNKNKHSSTLEHLNYTFDIDGISRALLQELARHRYASLSVKSTRYTLKELKECKEIYDIAEYIYMLDKEEVFNILYKSIEHIKAVKKFIILTDNIFVNYMSLLALINLQYVLKNGISNDKAKYCLPEAYKTSLVYTINARSLQNLLQLRTNKSALWEFQEVAKELYNNLPEDHKYLFKEFIHDY